MMLFRQCALLFSFIGRFSIQAFSVTAGNSPSVPYKASPFQQRQPFRSVISCLGGSKGSDFAETIENAKQIVGSDSLDDLISFFETNNGVQHKIQKIRAIACDVDGTILGSRNQVHPKTFSAIKKAINLAYNRDDPSSSLDYFFLATGKSRQGALDSLGEEIESLVNTYKVPGVYLQGLSCVDGEGKILYENKLPKEAIAAAEKLVKENGISIVGYDGDVLYTTEKTKEIRNFKKATGERTPKFLPTKEGEDEGTVRSLADYEPSMHKLLIMDSDVEMLNTVVRPQLEKIAKETGASVTQAIPGMLELVPAGCSKALGVNKMCEALGIDMRSELLGIGDAENDTELLEIAAIGVSMGNGCSNAKEAADFVLKETNDDGGAGIAIELFGFGSSKQ